MAIFALATKSKIRPYFMGMWIIALLLTLFTIFNGGSTGYIIFDVIMLIIISLLHYYVVYKKGIETYKKEIKDNKKYSVEINEDGISYNGRVQTKEITEWYKVGNLDTLIILFFRRDGQRFFLVIPINKNDLKELSIYLDSIIDHDQPKIFADYI